MQTRKCDEVFGVTAEACRKINTLSPPTEFNNLVVVLVSPRNPLNIGAVARAMSNFGFQRLRVVNPYEVAFRQARSAVHAGELLAAAEEYKSLDEAISDCGLVVGTTAVRHRDLQHKLEQLDQGVAATIRGQLHSGRVALLFGSEKYGLSNEDLSHCHWLVRIPTAAEHISMNLGQAVAVCLYELVRATIAEPVAESVTRAAAGEVERVTRQLLQVLEQSGYVIRGSETGSEERVRRLVRRMRLVPGDAEMWLGIFRQILWKLGKNQDEKKA
jgi:TrmH family RNA methyltransferase